MKGFTILLLLACAFAIKETSQKSFNEPRFLQTSNLTNEPTEDDLEELEEDIEKREEELEE